MNSDDRLERVLSDVLARSAPPRAPERLRHEILSTASRTRQRPYRFVAITSLLRFHTMTPVLRTAVIALVALAVGIMAVPHGGPSAPAAAPTAAPSSAATMPLLPASGPVEAGTYGARAFRPRTDEFLRTGQLGLTLPDGWAVISDWTSELRIEPVVANDAAAGDGSRGELRVWARPAALTSEDGCDPAEEPSVGRSYDELLAFLLKHPGLTIQADREATVGGYPAHIVDIAIAPTWTRTCPEVSGTGPVVPLFAEFNPFEPDGAIGAGWAWAAAGDLGLTQDPVRLVLIDLGQDDVVLVAVDSTLPEDQSAFVESAMPIVESLAFTQ